MSDLLRRRKKLTEPEARFYIVQLLGALKYLHDERVIHRDLKLGNLFLDNNMHVKVGDFGLATRLTQQDERKRTKCGTPNYIAPEILEGKNGHSYEFDVWSMGVILYTLIIGLFKIIIFQENLLLKLMTLRPPISLLSQANSVFLIILRFQKEPRA